MLCKPCFCTPSGAFSLFLFFYKKFGVEGFSFRFWGLGFKVGGLGFGIDIFVNMFSFSVGLVFAPHLGPFRRSCFLQKVRGRKVSSLDFEDYGLNF